MTTREKEDDSFHPLYPENFFTMKNIWNKIMSYLGWMTYVILAIMVVSILEWFSVALNMVIFDYIAIGLFGLVIVFLLFIAFNGVLIDIKESKKHKAAIKKKDKN